MKTEDIALWAGLITGLWGAILSSILAYRDWRRSRRQIKMVMWTDAGGVPFEFCVTNTSFRPITIKQVFTTLDGDGSEEFDLFTEESLGQLDSKLEDGEQVCFQCHTFTPGTPSSLAQRAKVVVRDTENHDYKKYETRVGTPPKYKSIFA